VRHECSGIRKRTKYPLNFTKAYALHPRPVHNPEPGDVLKYKKSCNGKFAPDNPANITRWAIFADLFLK